MSPQLQLILHQAITYTEKANFSKAKPLLEYILKLQPKNFDALHAMGFISGYESNHQQALHYSLQAFKIKPNDVDVIINCAKALQEIGKHLESIKFHQKALLLSPNSHEVWLGCGKSLQSLMRYDEAINHYDKALSLNPDFAATWSNKGNLLRELRLYEEAIAHYDKALNLNSGFAIAWSNKGITLNELCLYEEAITHFDKALCLSPDFAMAWANKGNTLKSLGFYEDAIYHYEKALSLIPDIDWVYGNLVDVKLKICSWSDIASLLEIISKKVIKNEKVSHPFSLLPLSDDAQKHKKLSEIYAKSHHPSNLALGEIAKSSTNGKIRIAYFSGDFKNHPVAQLIAELFEIHDKSQFEIYAFSLVKACDEMRGRLLKAFDYFFDVEGMSDIAVAKLARNNSIDIAIDLSGYTQDSRTGIFSHRAAPIQVNYLGYPSTMGADYIDYIIADKTLIPLESQSNYLEKIAYLPDSYQVNDRGRLISDRQFTKQELGLPEDGFVFCCFNNSFKILPSTFGNWMSILNAVEGSVLWLLRDNLEAVENLKKEAQNYGIDARRLIFAERMPLPEHLARHRQADLFLDTLPYNAHTTASDALWAGLPVLTLIGESFAGRVAASLLSAVGLPELITCSQEEYKVLAIDLATDPQKLAELKRRLADNRLNTPLFNTPLFTKHLEATYIKMYERYQNDLPPDHISII